MHRVGLAETHCVRPLTNIFALRGDGSVDSVLTEIRVAGWHVITRTRDDCVVLGPGGLVVIAERTGGRIRDEWADDARGQAQVVERMTGRPVEALVVLQRHVEWREPRPFRGATLMPVSALAEHLTSRPRTIAPADIDVLRGRMQRALAI